MGQNVSNGSNWVNMVKMGQIHQSVGKQKKYNKTAGKLQGKNSKNTAEIQWKLHHRYNPTWITCPSTDLDLPNKGGTKGQTKRRTN